jgi:hypothetical protein
LAGKIFPPFIASVSLLLSQPSNPNTCRAIQHIKIFKGFESNLPGLEKEVNDWLAKSGVKVQQIFGNLAPQTGERTENNSLSTAPYFASDALIVVLYEKT